MIEGEVGNYLIYMCIAAFISPAPDDQVRKMARRFKKNTSNELAKRSLKKIIKSSKPSLVVRLAYEDLTQ